MHFAELDVVSPLLYRLVAVFEAWSLQSEMYLKGLPAPLNVLELDGYYKEGQDVPCTSYDFKINAVKDPKNNPFKVCERVSIGLAGLLA